MQDNTNEDDLNDIIYLDYDIGEDKPQTIDGPVTIEQNIKSRLSEISRFKIQDFKIIEIDYKGLIHGTPIIKIKVPRESKDEIESEIMKRS